MLSLYQKNDGRASILFLNFERFVGPHKRFSHARRDNIHAFVPLYELPVAQ